MLKSVFNLISVFAFGVKSAFDLAYVFDLGVKLGTACTNSVLVGVSCGLFGVKRHDVVVKQGCPIFVKRGELRLY